MLSFLFGAIIVIIWVASAAGGVYVGFKAKDYIDKKIRRYYQRGRKDQQTGHNSALGIAGDTLTGVPTRDLDIDLADTSNISRETKLHSVTTKSAV